MHLPASDKTAEFGKKPRIKKAYYPAQLLGVEEFKNQDGTPKLGRFGFQLIFEFAIYEADPKTGAPVAPLTYIADEKTNKIEDVIIPKFIYYQYKNKQKPGEYQTAITPNSAITKLLKALGWKFDAEGGVDMEPLVGNWVEVCIDDYEQKLSDTETYIASTIKEVTEYAGPAPPKSFGPTKSDKPVKEKPKTKAAPAKGPVIALDEIKDEIKDEGSAIDPDSEKRGQLKDMLNENLLTQEGYDQAIEQLDAKKKGG